MLALEDFNYNLPPELIAQKPVSPRDHSRLLILAKKSGEISHRHFYDILDYLKRGDVLVVNNSKVFPARLIGQKELTGGKVEVFLLRASNNKQGSSGKQGNSGQEIWECLVGGRIQAGLKLNFPAGLQATILRDNSDSTWQVEFNKSGRELMRAVERIGQVPLPPYIKRGDGARHDKKTYQTIYANENKIGSVAAPTAGFHFTPALIRKIKLRGVKVLEVTLHVGLGTFQPVKSENVLEHKMHSEFIEVRPAVWKKILLAKKQGRRVIAVGTTSARTLETLGQKFSGADYVAKLLTPGAHCLQAPIKLWTDIFIYPPYEFRIVDALITNFHLPKSTLLMLVSALAGKTNIDKAYETAISRGYRFYSYGDAMLIL